MSLSRVHVSRTKEISHMLTTRPSLGKYLVGMGASLLIFLAGGWLILAPFALGYQPYGADWVNQTTADFATGMPVAVVALVGFAFFFASLLGALRAATALALVPATAQSDLDRTLSTLAAALAADLSARRQAGDQSIEQVVTRREA